MESRITVEFSELEGLVLERLSTLDPEQDDALIYKLKSFMGNRKPSEDHVIYHDLENPTREDLLHLVVYSI